MPISPNVCNEVRERRRSAPRRGAPSIAILAIDWLAPDSDRSITEYDRAIRFLLPSKSTQTLAFQIFGLFALPKARFAGHGRRVDPVNSVVHDPHAVS